MHDIGKWFIKQMNGCIIITTGHIIWANVNIQYGYITTDEWMHGE